MKNLLVILLGLAIIGAALAKSHHRDNDHHDSDSSSSSSDSSSSSSSSSEEDHHDSDEDHHDNDEDHHDSDEDHHDDDHHHRGHRIRKFIQRVRHRRHHDDDDDHHDSDEDDDHHGRPLAKAALIRAVLRKIRDRHDDHHDNDEDHDDDDDDHHGRPLAKAALVRAVLNKIRERHDDSDEDHDDDDDDHHGRPLAKAAIVSAVLRKLRDRHDDSDEDHHDDDDDDHVYYIHVGDGFGPYEYVDSDGRLKGFDIDLTNAVCEKAHKTCHIVHDSDETCWHTRGAHQLPGEGLLDHWYDGCMGLSPTPERLNSFNFTTSHTPNVKAGLFFRNGEAPAKNDLHGKKIGFVAGWAMSRACLSRQDAFDGNTEPDYTSVMYETHGDMVQGLIKKEVDAILSIEGVDLQKQGVTAVAPWFYCTLAGQSVMTRYGSDLIPWWNKALDRLIDSGEYKKLCQRARDVHGSHGQLACLE